MRITDFRLGRSLWVYLPLTLVSIAGGSAYANITPVLNSVTKCTSGVGAGTCSSDDGGSYTGAGYAWAYQIDLDGNETVDPTSNTLGSSGSSYGAIYDFGPMLGSAVASGSLSNPANFTIFTALTTTAPGGLSPSDSAALMNIVYQAKVGTDINGSPNGTVLGTITVISAYAGTSAHAVNFVGQAISNATGLSTANIGSVEAPNVTPEPASISLLLVGVVGAFVFLRRRVSRG